MILKYVLVVFFRRADDIQPDDDAVSRVKVNQVGVSESGDVKKCPTNSFIERRDYTYEEYAEIVDRLSFGIFSMMTCSVTLGFMLYIATGDSV